MPEGNFDDYHDSLAYWPEEDDRRASSMAEDQRSKFERVLHSRRSRRVEATLFLRRDVFNALKMMAEIKLFQPFPSYFRLE